MKFGISRIIKFRCINWQICGNQECSHYFPHIPIHNCHIKHHACIDDEYRKYRCKKEKTGGE